MASGIVVSLQEEVMCPICLELLTEPLSLDCGHSFCQACITANNMVSMNDPDEDRRCPVCRISYEPGNLRPNRHVANIVQRLREVKLSPEVEQERHLCLRHGEKLMLFCEEDREVICWLCERSQEHHGHHTFLMEEVAQDYQKKLQEALEKLREKQLEAEELEVKVRADIAAWKDQIQRERENVKAVFQKLRKNLKYEEVKEMQKLKRKEEVGLRNLADSEHVLIQQSQLVRNLMSDVERRLKGSTMEMLQDVNDIMKRSETLTLKKPRTLPKGQRRTCSALDLTDIQQVYNGEECYLSGCLWNSCDGGKTGRRLQFLDVDRDSKAQILCI
uniref:Tripartite motif-containing protein 5 n=1 Tax=Capra hircus TaxID=9925 RepID=A0A452DVI3_CAPHI